MLAGQGASACVLARVSVYRRGSDTHTDTHRDCVLVLQHEHRGRQTVMMLVSYIVHVRAR